MKTAEIKDILKKDILIIELQTDVINSSYHIQKTPKGILIKDDTEEKFISNKYTLLGKPAEISEVYLWDLVHYEYNEMSSELFCRDYNSKWIDNYDLTSLTESLLSAIESEITESFDFKRTLIFVKN